MMRIYIFIWSRLLLFVSANFVTGFNFSSDDVFNKDGSKFQNPVLITALSIDSDVPKPSAVTYSTKDKSLKLTSYDPGNGCKPMDGDSPIGYLAMEAGMFSLDKNRNFFAATYDVAKLGDARAMAIVDPAGSDVPVFPKHGLDGDNNVIDVNVDSPVIIVQLYYTEPPETHKYVPHAYFVSKTIDKRPNWDEFVLMVVDGTDESNTTAPAGLKVAVVIMPDMSQGMLLRENGPFVASRTYSTDDAFSLMNQMVLHDISDDSLGSINRCLTPMFFTNNAVAESYTWGLNCTSDAYLEDKCDIHVLDGKCKTPDEIKSSIIQIVQFVNLQCGFLLNSDELEITPVPEYQAYLKAIEDNRNKDNMQDALDTHCAWMILSLFTLFILLALLAAFYIPSGWFVKSKEDSESSGSSSSGDPSQGRTMNSARSRELRPREGLYQRISPPAQGPQVPNPNNPFANDW